MLVITTSTCRICFLKGPTSYADILRINLEWRLPINVSTLLLKLGAAFRRHLYLFQPPSSPTSSTIYFASSWRLLVLKLVRLLIWRVVLALWILLPKIITTPIMGIQPPTNTPARSFIISPVLIWLLTAQLAHSTASTPITHSQLQACPLPKLPSPLILSAPTRSSLLFSPWMQSNSMWPPNNLNLASQFKLINRERIRRKLQAFNHLCQALYTSFWCRTKI